MKWFPAFQQKIGRYFLKRKKNVPHTPTLNQDIGIIFDARNQEWLDAIRGYTKTLEKKSLTFTAYAYTGKATLPEEDNFIFINDNDLNWLYHPKIQVTNILENQRLETLITFHTENKLIFEYLATRAPASLKIGPYIPSAVCCYDLMINAPDVSTFLKTLDYIMISLKKKRKHESKILQTI